MRIFPVFLAIFLVVSGCASLTEEQCQSQEWQKIGREDAIQGRTTARMNEHTKACKRYGIVPNPVEYKKGYDVGLVSYCTIENGFKVGRKGYYYLKICPVEREASFLSGYERGKEIHRIESSIAEAKSDRSDVDRKIYDAEQIKDKKERRRELDRLNKRRKRLNNEVDRLWREKVRAIEAAERFLAEHAPNT